MPPKSAKRFWDQGMRKKSCPQSVKRFWDQGMRRKLCPPKCEAVLEQGHAEKTMRANVGGGIECKRKPGALAGLSPSSVFWPQYL